MSGEDLTTAQVAERLGIAKPTVTLWCRQGRFPNARHEETPFGSYWLIPASDLRDVEKPKPGRPPKPPGNGAKSGTIESQTKTTRRLDSSVKRAADQQMAGRKKGVKR